MAACAKKQTATASTASTNATSAATYTADMLPLNKPIAVCHLPSKGGNKTNFEDYETTKKHAADIVRRIQMEQTQRGFMPAKHDKLSADEIAVFKKWLDGNAAEK
ncbi:MAG: hypothetical protein R2765_06690 [Ferruginibacter sp.]